MAVIYDKTYRPVNLNVDAELLGRLDAYKTGTISRSRLIHAALELYLEHLEHNGARKSTWSVFGAK
jgi:metal-responsive CopG/Arc/MetJ family transcriptional regulator